MGSARAGRKLENQIIAVGLVQLEPTEVPNEKVPSRSKIVTEC